MSIPKQPTISEFFLPPVGWQTSLIRAVEKDIWCLGGRQIGKSRTCISMQCTDVMAGGKNIYSCPDPSIADNNWVDICNAFTDIGGRQIRVNKVEKGVIEFKSPVSGRIGQYRRYIAQMRVKRTGTQRVRGARTNSILHDEIQTAVGGEKYYAAASALTLTTRGREFVCMTAPADPVQAEQCKWIIEKFDRAGLLKGAGTDAGAYVHSPPGFPDTLFIRQPTTPEILAPVLRAVSAFNGEPEATYDDHWWEKQAEDVLGVVLGKIGETEFRCEYLCSMETDKSGLIINEWADGMQTADAEYDPLLPVYWCADAGEGEANSVVLMFQVKPLVESVPDGKGGAVEQVVSRFNVFDELYTLDPKNGDEIMLAHAMQFSRDRRHEMPLNHDATSERASLYALPLTVYPDIHAKGLIRGCDEIGLDHHEASYPVWTQIRTLNYLIRSGRLKVHPRCRLLASNFATWMRTMSGEPQADNNDAAQACAYGVLGYLVQSGEGISEVEKARAILDNQNGNKRNAVELLLI